MTETSPTPTPTPAIPQHSTPARGSWRPYFFALTVGLAVILVEVLGVPTLIKSWFAGSSTFTNEQYAEFRRRFLIHCGVDKDAVGNITGISSPPDTVFVGAIDRNANAGFGDHAYFKLVWHEKDKSEEAWIIEAARPAQDGSGNQPAVVRIVPIQELNNHEHFEAARHDVVNITRFFRGENAKKLTTLLANVLRAEREIKWGVDNQCATWILDRLRESDVVVSDRDRRLIAPTTLVDVLVDSVRDDAVARLTQVEKRLESLSERRDIELLSSVCTLFDEMLVKDNGISNPTPVADWVVSNIEPEIVARFQGYRYAILEVSTTSAIHAENWVGTAHGMRVSFAAVPPAKRDDTATTVAVVEVGSVGVALDTRASGCRQTTQIFVPLDPKSGQFAYRPEYDATRNDNTGFVGAKLRISLVGYVR